MNFRTKVSILTFFLISFLFSECTDSTSIKDESPIRFKLSSDKSIGVSPLKVNFTGTLYGQIDTLKLFYPPLVLYPGTDKTVIRFAENDTFVNAQRIYNSRYNYISAVPDTFKAYMLLQGLNRDYISDTIEIVLQ